MARTLVGWTDAHYVLDPATNRALPGAALDVQDLATGAAVTDLEAPTGFAGEPFPAGQARSDDQGFYGFTVPEGTPPVRVRFAATATKEAGPWLTPVGQVLANGPVKAEIAAERAFSNATYATLRAALLGNQQECTSVARVDLPSTPSPPALIRPRDPRTRRIVIQNVGANPAKFEYLNNGFFGFAYDTFEGAYNIIVDPGEEYIDTYRGGWLWGISPLGTTVVVQVTLGADS